VPVVSATPAAKPAAKATARPGPAEKPGKPSGPRLSTLLSEFKKDLATEGRPDGSPDGDAATPGEGDEYLAQVRQLLRQNYRLPTTISERERQFLTGTVVLYIEADGRISRSEVTKRSGNAAFDEALERAVREVRLPPPPPERRQLYRNGVNFEFKI
jgi:colicin import membrane protein/protein TonB